MRVAVVVAAVNDDFEENVVALSQATPPEHTLMRMDTSGGGWPTLAYQKAFYRWGHEYDAFLFLQDSLAPTVDDIVSPFVGPDVCAWARFPMFFDNRDQMEWVTRHGYKTQPRYGVFGPVFYATTEALRAAHVWFPRTPHSRNEYQGSERAWAFCFAEVGIEVRALYEWDPAFLASGDAHPLKKTFALRPDVKGT